MSKFFKNKRKLALALGAIFLAITLGAGSFAFLGKDMALQVDLSSIAPADSGQPDPDGDDSPFPDLDREAETGDDQWEELPEGGFMSFNAPSEMRGTFLTPGVDFLAGGTTQDVIQAEVDVAFAAARELAINTLIVDTIKDGQVIYQTKDAPELSTGFDILAYIVGKARQEDFYIYTTFDASLYRSRSPLASALSVSAGAQDQLTANLSEFAAKYQVDGILVDGYTSTAESQSYATYISTGGGIGFDNFMRQTPAAIVKSAANTIRKAAPSTQVGLLADAVWENQSSHADGSATEAAFTSLGNGNADTKAFVEKGYVDFVAIKAYSTIDSQTEPFGEVVSWWADVARQNDIPVYVVHATSKLYSGESGWSSSDQLILQLAEVEETSGVRGSIFNNLQTVSTSNQTVVDNVKKVYETETPAEQILTQLEMTRPAQTTFTTSDPQVRFTGASDPDEKVTINGKAVETDSTGYFSVYENLRTGLNTFKIEHKGKTVTYSITREVEVLKEASPTGSITTEGGMSITISAVAYQDADVYAVINGTTVPMSPASTLEDEQDRDGYFRTFTGQYTAPAATGQVQNLGSIVVYGEYDGKKDSITAASVRINKKAQLEDGVAVRITADQAITYPPDTLNNIPVAQYYPLPKGAMDYAVGDEIVYTKTDGTEYRYYVLSSGLRVETKDFTAVSDDFPSNNAISGLSVKSEGSYTYVTLKMSQQVTYSVKYAASGISYTFHHTSSVPSDMGLSKNPLFTSANWSGQTLTLGFAKSGGFMGYKGYYDDSGNLVLRFRNPPSSLSNARIAIDPGHGGKDIGASGFLADYPESVINRQIAQAVAAELESRGATVKLMDNSGIKLEQRKLAAEKLEPDLFISIHANSAPNASAVGTEVFYFHGFSQTLAANVSKAVSSALGSTNRGAKQSYYHVTLSSQMPNVLIETGFLTNQEEYEKLINSKYQKKIATGIADALAATIKSANTGVSASGSESVGNAADPGTATSTKDDNEPDTSQGSSDTTNKNTTIENIWIDDSIELAVGKSTTLWPEIYPDDATDDGLAWTSSDPSVAEVDANGKVAAKSAGSATITVKTGGNGPSATCEVTVVTSTRGGTVKVDDLELNETSLSLSKGETFLLRPDFSPDDASNKNITFRSNRSSIVSVSATGKVTALASGDAVVTAVSQDGSKKVECEIAVYDAAGSAAKTSASDSGVSLSSTKSISQPNDYITINPGVTVRLQVYSALSELVRGGDLTWTSEDTSIATVDAMGNVTAKAVGQTEIIASAGRNYDELSWYIEVTRDKIAISGISLDESSITIRKGENFTLAATVYPSNATGRNLAWSSDNAKIASVDANGKVTGMSPGTAVITAKSKDNAKIYETCEVEVVSASSNATTTTSKGKVQGFYLYYDGSDADGLALSVGETGRLTYEYWPASVDDPGVVWESKSPGVVKVDSNGNIECLKRGSATVMVKSATDSSVRTSITIKVQ